MNTVIEKIYINILVLAYSVQVFAQSYELNQQQQNFSRFLEHISPYSSSVTKLVRNPECQNSRCEKYKPERDDTLIEQLGFFLNNENDFINSECSKSNKSQSVAVYCNKLLHLKNFLEIENSLNQCKSNQTLDDELDRIIATSSMVHSDDPFLCRNSLRETYPLEIESERNLNNLNEAFENEEHLQLAGFLIADSLEESMKAYLSFNKILGQNNNQIDVNQTFCQEVTNDDMFGMTAAAGLLETKDVCGDQGEGLIERALARKKDQANSEANSRSVSQTKDHLNNKVELINELVQARNNAIKEANQAIRQKRDSIVVKAQGGLMNVEVFQRDLLRSINTKFEQDVKTVLHTVENPGSDELVQTSILRDLFEFKNLSNQQINEVEKISDSQVDRALREARYRSAKQVRELIKMHENMMQKKSDPNSIQYRDIKKNLARLVRTNPVSAGRAMIANPSWANNLCQINQTMKDIEDREKFWKNTFLVVGVGAGVAMIAATAGAGSGIVLAAGTLTSIALSTTEVTVSNQFISNAKQSYSDNLAVYLAGMGDQQSIEDIEKAITDQKSAELHRNLAAILAPLDLFGVGQVARAVSLPNKARRLLGGEVGARTIASFNDLSKTQGFNHFSKLFDDEAQAFKAIDELSSLPAEQRTLVLREIRRYQQGKVPDQDFIKLIESNPSLSSLQLAFSRNGFISGDSLLEISRVNPQMKRNLEKLLGTQDREMFEELLKGSLNKSDTSTILKFGQILSGSDQNFDEVVSELREAIQGCRK